MVVFHCWNVAGQFALPTFAVVGVGISPLGFIPGGYSGVDLFFLLSGVCLALPIMRRRDAPVGWRRYAVNRVRRIIPPYWTVMALFLAGGALIAALRLDSLTRSHFLEAPSPRDIGLSLALDKYTMAFSFWTLPLEWRWYFLFPLLVLLARRFGAVWAIGVTLLIAIPTRLFVTEQGIGWLGPQLTALPLYLPHFCLGLLAAEILARPQRPAWQALLLRHAWLGVLCGVALVVVVQPVFVQPLLRLSSWAVLYFFLILAATGEGRIGRLASWRPLVFVGAFSYTLYLVHENLILLIYRLSGAAAWSSTQRLLVFEGLVLPLCVLVGFAVFTFAERPWLRRPRQAQLPAR